MLKSLNLPAKIQLSRTETVSSVEALQKAFEESKKLGHEGPVVKDPGSPYWPGRRGKYWIKLKKELETLGFVVVAAEFGHGK